MKKNSMKIFFSQKWTLHTKFYFYERSYFIIYILVRYTYIIIILNFDYNNATIKYTWMYLFIILTL